MTEEKQARKVLNLWEVHLRSPPHLRAMLCRPSRCLRGCAASPFVFKLPTFPFVPAESFFAFFAGIVLFILLNFTQTEFKKDVICMKRRIT
jgi:hypothetical protein